MQSKGTLVVISGPSGVGKTELAIRLAERLGGEIVCCDSMQIYRVMDIGTAKPTPEEQARVPHHLFDFIDPFRSYSCADYCADAEKVIEDILSRGKLPIVCGGTGLYLDRFLKGGNDDGAACDESVREELKKFVDENGIDALHERLCNLDPESAATIHKNNVKRVMRAIEICLVTGEKKSEIDKKNAEIVDKYDHTVITLSFMDRELLYRRIEERVDKMMADGLLDETKRLMDTGVFERSVTAAQAIGYKELFPYLRGEATLSECVEELKAATRRYAKRQVTWFSGKDYAHKVYVDGENGLKTFEDIVNFSSQLF